MTEQERRAMTVEHKHRSDWTLDAEVRSFTSCPLALLRDQRVSSDGVRLWLHLASFPPDTTISDTRGDDLMFTGERLEAATLSLTEAGWMERLGPDSYRLLSPSWAGL